MITLQAAEGENPAIEWNEASTYLYAQTQEAQNWVQTNILNTEADIIYEDAIRPSDSAAYQRIKTQTYNANGYTIVVDRNYPTMEDYDGITATYTLTVN